MKTATMIGLGLTEAAAMLLCVLALVVNVATGSNVMAYLAFISFLVGIVALWPLTTR